MSHRKAKTTPKVFISDRELIKKRVLEITKRIAEIVGCTLGPGGRTVLLESDLPGVSHRISKDGVGVFTNLGAIDAIDHVIIETARDCAQRVGEGAGDGPQPLYSKVLTPKGFVEMRDIRAGMEICGTNGTIQKVLDVFVKGQKEIYEIEIENKGIVECCGDHLWSVIYNNNTRAIKPLRDLAGDYKTTVSDTYSNEYNEYKYYIPSTYVEYYENKSEMPLDPYLVGVLLGDGSLRESGSIELSLGKKKEHIIDKLILPDGITANCSYVENKNYFRVKITGTDKNGKTIRDHVSSLGLNNADSFTKFIPKSYLRSSKTSREALLQGLIDTDGHINKRGLFEFSSVSKELADDFVELAMGLGKPIYRKLHERSVEDGCYSNTPTHRITELKGYKYGNKIIRISKTGKFTEMKCIKVSNPDNLYITDNFVVTHNTTTTTILVHQLIKNLQEFCANNPKYSPQKAVRKIKKAVNEILVPYIRSRAIQINESNTELLKKVGTISANGDSEMANKVYECFEMIGFGEGSHITIKELPGPEGYKIERVDGLAVYSGHEDLGKFSNVFINDVGNQRTYLEKPLFILFDGMINDLIQITPILNEVGERYANGDETFKNIIIVAHGFSDNILTTLALNFVNTSTINIMPLKTPMRQFINSQQSFLHDLSAFTGAKVFGLKDQLSGANLHDLGSGMEYFESHRFRSTVVGDPDPMNVEVRAADLKKMMENSESKAESIWLQERIALLTCGIAKFTIYAGSGADLKEKHDRCEDATMAMRSAIKYGCLPGGTRIAIDMAVILAQELPEGDPARDVLMESLLSLPKTLLDNAGHNPEEISEVISKLIENTELVYDIENEHFGKAEDLGLFDATKAVEESLIHSVSIAGVLGTLGGIVVAPRDAEFERSEARADAEFMRNVNNPESVVNEANLRP